MVENQETGAKTPETPGAASLALASLSFEDQLKQAGGTGEELRDQQRYERWESDHDLKKASKQFFELAGQLNTIVPDGIENLRRRIARPQKGSVTSVKDNLAYVGQAIRRTFANKTRIFSKYITLGGLNSNDAGSLAKYHMRTKGWQALMAAIDDVNASSGAHVIVPGLIKGTADATLKFTLDVAPRPASAPEPEAEVETKPN